jgi:hypothetical protein
VQVGIKIWHRSLCRGLLKGIIGSRKTESENVRKALEYRTYGTARSLRNLRRCRWLLIFTQKIQVCLYERLPGPRTPSKATIGTIRSVFDWKSHATSSSGLGTGKMTAHWANPIDARRHSFDVGRHAPAQGLN